VCRQTVPRTVSATFDGVPHLLGYARVSTTEQNPDLQVDELTAAGCWRVWTDHASGALDRRPQLHEVLEQLRPGDTLVVWRLDRLGRSLRHLIDVVTDLDERGAGFRSLRENIDTTTAGGRLVFHLFGALAQFEREIIRDRTVAGLTAARARGRVGGRPSKLSVEQRRQARKMYDERELTVEQIGRVLGVSRTSIYRALADRPAASTDGPSAPQVTDGQGGRRAPRRRPPERS
jgi:DNA invertase Pin-like site-specific DNA recombinase